MKKIPLPKYATGPSRYDYYKKFESEELPEGFSDAYPFNAEAVTAGNYVGGRPSGHYHRELCRAIEAYNSGTEYKTTFLDRSASEIAEQKNRREIGIETDVNLVFASL